MTSSTSRSTSPPDAHLALPAVTEWRAALSRPGVVLLPLRLFLGLTFTFAGLQKLADPHFFEASRPTSIQAQLAPVPRRPARSGSCSGRSQHHAVAVRRVHRVVEIGVGLGTLLGLWSRAAARLGALLSLSFFLTVSWKTRPYYYGSDIVFVFAWTAVHPGRRRRACCRWMPGVAATRPQGR